MSANKNIKYINKDFNEFKASLIDYTKTYFPTTYNDFSPASPGMMFIEMASYVGDVLSYYTDYVFKESILSETKERRNIISLARYLGYKVKPARASAGKVDVYQLIPPKEENGEYSPNYDYALNIRENMQVSNNAGSTFLTSEPVNFSVDTDSSPLEISVYSRGTSNIPTFFLLKKTVNIRSGKIIKKNFSVGGKQSFLRLTLDEDNVLEIISVTDSDNNKWYEVDYLAQDVVLSGVPNDDNIEGHLAQYKDTVPYILKYLRTSKRFTTNVNENNKTYLEFGAGSTEVSDQLVNISSQKVGVGLSNFNSLNIPLDPSNFLNNDSYGLSPANTIITVTYSIGGGYEANSPSNGITNTDSYEMENSTEGMTPDEINLLNTVRSSLRVNNEEATTGGKGEETNEEIKQNAVALFAAQNRSVTRDDYLMRLYSLPAKYGTIAKAHITTNNSLEVGEKQILVGTVSGSLATVDKTNVEEYLRKIVYDRSNPFAINAYILTYDSNKNLIVSNTALINNLLNYMKQYRILTDSINFIDGYVINIGVEFSIKVYKGYNKKEILTNVLDTVKGFFNIDQWEMNQPINLSQLRLEIANVEGVQSIVSLTVKNKTPLTTGGQNYSSVEYDIEAASKDDIIYPSLDPCIFEVKYPDSDIKGTVL